MATANRPIKIVVVGDGTVGKTCLLISYTTGSFPKGEYVATVFDNFADVLEVDGVRVNMTLWDTAGQEDYERLRPLCYPGTDVFLVCFSVDSTVSFNNVSSKWHPEIKHNCPKSPCILVGTKTDLRNGESGGTKMVTKSMAKKVASSLKAYKYIECSAKTMENVTEVFEQAVRAVINPKTKNRRTCKIL